MIAGIAFAVLFAAALLIAPTLPGIDKPGYDIVSHVNQHSSAMRMQALLVTFGLLALVVVLGYARDRLAGSASTVASWTSIEAMLTTRISSSTPIRTRCFRCWVAERFRGLFPVPAQRSG